MILDNSYVKHQNKCYKPLVGIPTGGCNSRQTADIVLRRLIGKVKNKIPQWKLIKWFKRYIDDIILLWLGTKRQFSKLVVILNKFTEKFGITFDEFAISEMVHSLDISIYTDSERFIRYKLFRKPTDSRHYLKVGSFHPPHIFHQLHSHKC